MPRFRQLLTGRLTPAVFEEVARLLPLVATAETPLSPAERRELAALLDAAGAWIEGWRETLQLQAGEPSTYTI